MNALDAIDQKNLKQLKKIIKEDHNFNINDTVKKEKKYITTPLVRACQNGDLEVVEFLLEQKADVNRQAQDAVGNTPLYVACDNGNLNLARLLLKKGAYVDTQIRLNRMSPLHAAIKGGFLEIVKLLLKHDAEVNVMSSTGTPLHEAVVQRSTQVAKLLLQHGADVNRACSKTNETPLHKSIELDYISMTEILIDSEADINVRLNQNGYTPLCVAVQHKKSNSLRYLLQRQDIQVDVVVSGPKTPLGLATEMEYVEAMKMLIQAGADVNFVTSSDENFEGGRLDESPRPNSEEDVTPITPCLTPLMIAAKYGHRRAVELLLAKGAEVNKQNLAGNTALHYAVYDQNGKDGIKIQKVCTLLMRHKAMCKMPNNNLVSPFYYCVRRKMFTILEMFLASGADPNEGDVNDSTAFHYLAECPQVYKLLAKYRVDPNLKNTSGRTPIHYAATSYDTKPDDIEKLLTEFSVEIVPDRDGELPCHVAKKVDVIDVFRKRGYGIDAMTWDGETILHSAIRNRHNVADIKRMLKWEGLDTGAENNDGLTAMDLAKQMLNVAVCRALEEDKREKEMVKNSPAKITKKITVKKTQPITNKKVKARQKGEPPNYLKVTQNQQNRLNDEANERDWDRNLRDGKITELKATGGVSHENKPEPRYARDTENMVNRQKDLGEYEQTNWDKQLRGGKKAEIVNTEEKEKHKEETNTDNKDRPDSNENENLDPENAVKSDSHANSDEEDSQDNEQTDSGHSELKGILKTADSPHKEVHCSFDEKPSSSEDYLYKVSPRLSDFDEDEYGDYNDDELLEIFGEKRKRVCSFYDSPTSGEDEVLYDGYGDFLNDSTDGEGSRNGGKSTRSEDGSPRKTNGSPRKSHGSPSKIHESPRKMNKEAAKNRKAKASNKTDEKAEPKKKLVKKVTKPNTKGNNFDNSNGGKPAKTKNVNKNEKIQDGGKKKKLLENTNIKVTNNKTPRKEGDKTKATPRKGDQERADEKIETKNLFCDVAVIHDQENIQKADQICEYIKRRGRVFVVAQPQLTKQDFNDDGSESKEKSEAKQHFMRMLKQAKIVCVITSEKLKSHSDSLEFCAYTDQLYKVVYPIQLESTPLEYEPSCLLDLMLGNKHHYQVGIQYEQEMGKLLAQIKEKIHL